MLIKILTMMKIEKIVQLLDANILCGHHRKSDTMFKASGILYARGLKPLY